MHGTSQYAAATQAGAQTLAAASELFLSAVPEFLGALTAAVVIGLATQLRQRLRRRAENRPTRGQDNTE
ncbi:hypothetical protein ABZ802_03615 [Streptomyces sp. NPDC047737]|jgi:hypothetical protein|uniref:hypothetical protein n=1 Tax=unclassified Streptomyces TaxID=2593676 RepID=UPI0033E3EF3D